MSILSIKVETSELKAKLPILLSAAKNPRQMMLGVGREAGNQLKKHFRDRDRDGANQLAPDRRTHFWLGVSRGVQPAVVSEGGNTVTVTIVHPALSQKIKGGTIVAKRVQNLAIPVSPEAYGRSPATFEQQTGLKLFVLRQGGTTGNTKTSIVLAAATGPGHIEVEYVLKHSVNQKPDPNALPDMGPGSSFEAALLDRGQTILARQLQQGGLS